ncbi:putative methyltransferase type 11 [Streptomyces azureus]|uniref:Putative methyltransferase type 11 n=1 Tax=Streptomyces azureus TaxID=146537 RepID=A0A0K8PMV3_STRAJ|nr:putative methyltransferase type 11 [Streptomyces azureus]
MAGFVAVGPPARIDTSDTLAALLEGPGLSGPRVVRRDLAVHLTPATAWDLAVGSGTRPRPTGARPPRWNAFAPTSPPRWRHPR